MAEVSNKNTYDWYEDLVNSRGLERRVLDGFEVFLGWFDSSI